MDSGLFGATLLSAGYRRWEWVVYGSAVRRMFPAQLAHEPGIGFPGFAHGVVAAVEVFALFELVLQEVFFVGEFAVEAEELLLFFCELL